MWGLNELRQKLDIMSGVIYEIQGFVKIIANRTKDIKVQLDSIIQLLKDSAPTNIISLRFAKVKFLETGMTVEGDLKKMNLDDLSKVTFTLEATDRKGRPAQVQNPTFAISDPSLATGEQSTENPLEFTVTRIQGTSGVFVVHAEADADLGEGVKQLVAEEAVNATLAEANILSLKAGEPSDA